MFRTGVPDYQSAPQAQTGGTMPKLFRVRYMPYEIVELFSDRILFRDNRYLITSWEPIHPRNDIKSGISCVFLDEGWKISAMKDAQGNITWYCDIVDIRYDAEEDALYFHDLLVDVVLRKDSRLEVLDLDELAEAFEKGLITKEQLVLALKRCNSLLQKIYSTDVPSWIAGMIGSLTHEGGIML